MDVGEFRVRAAAMRRKHRGRGRLVTELLELLEEASETIETQAETIARLSGPHARSLLAVVSAPEDQP